MSVNYFGRLFRKSAYGQSNNSKYNPPHVCKKEGDCCNTTDYVTTEPQRYAFAAREKVTLVPFVCRSSTHCGGPTPQILQAKTRKIYNISNMYSSEYAMNLAAFTVNTNTLNKGKAWNQSSDRLNKHVNKNPVPSRGASTHGSITRLRPGALKPGGAGVDIKHNSYARFLNKKKGNAMLAGAYKADDVDQNAIVNNKVQKLNSINCSCYSHH